MAAHSPSPWVFLDGEEPGTIYSGAKGEFGEVAHIVGFGEEDCLEAEAIETNRANRAELCRRFNAFPQLLAVCERFLTLTGESQSASDDKWAIGEISEQARAAIAKAEKGGR
ncbi:unnamed protein product, partial [marine sediment metagenome]